jgi:hypothetical protein
VNAFSATIQARRDFPALGGLRNLITIRLTPASQGSACHRGTFRVSLTTSCYRSEAAVLPVNVLRKAGNPLVHDYRYVLFVDCFSAQDALLNLLDSKINLFS